MLYPTGGPLGKGLAARNQVWLVTRCHLEIRRGSFQVYDTLVCSCTASVVVRTAAWTTAYSTLFLVLSCHIWTSFKLNYARLFGMLYLLFALTLTWLAGWVMEWELSRATNLSIRVSPLLLILNSGEVRNLRDMLRLLSLLLLAAYEVYRSHLHNWTLCINEGWAIATHLTWCGWRFLALFIGHESLGRWRNNLGLVEVIIVYSGGRVLLLLRSLAKRRLRVWLNSHCNSIGIEILVDRTSWSLVASRDRLMLVAIWGPLIVIFLVSHVSVFSIRSLITHQSTLMERDSFSSEWSFQFFGLATLMCLEGPNNLASHLSRLATSAFTQGNGPCTKISTLLNGRARAIAIIMVCSLLILLRLILLVMMVMRTFTNENSCSSLILFLTEISCYVIETLFICFSILWVIVFNLLHCIQLLLVIVI